MGRWSQEMRSQYGGHLSDKPPTNFFYVHAYNTQTADQYITIPPPSKIGKPLTLAQSS